MPTGLQPVSVICCSPECLCRLRVFVWLAEIVDLIIRPSLPGTLRLLETSTAGTGFLIRLRIPHLWPYSLVTSEVLISHNIDVCQGDFLDGDDVYLFLFEDTLHFRFFLILWMLWFSVSL